MHTRSENLRARASRRASSLIAAAIVISFSLAAAPVCSQSRGEEYHLGSGDRVKIIVFGEEELSGEFEIDGTGRISVPLIGVAQSGGLSVRDLEVRLTERFREYLVSPKLAIEVLNYRPFYILGEVEEPGSYPYRAGMTVLNAVVMAGGYTYRADEDDISVQRGGSATTASDASPETKVLPGDVIRVDERFF